MAATSGPWALRWEHDMTRHKPDELVRYDKDQEPLILFKTTFEALKNEPNWADPLALYCLYYYTAKWQGNSSVARCSNRYAARMMAGPDGRKWSLTRVIRNRRILEKMGLVGAVTERSPQGHIIGHYVEVSLLTKADPDKARDIREPTSADPEAKPKPIHRRYCHFATVWYNKHRRKHPSFYAKRSEGVKFSEMAKAAVELERLVRLDGWGWKDQVKPALLWALRDRFWGADGNLRSLTRVRHVGRNGSTKFANIHAQYVRTQRNPEKKAFEHCAAFPQLSMLSKDRSPEQRRDGFQRLIEEFESLSSRLAFYDRDTGKRAWPKPGDDTSNLSGPGRTYRNGRLAKEFDHWAAKRVEVVGFFPSFNTVSGTWVQEFLRELADSKGVAIV